MEMLGLNIWEFLAAIVNFLLLLWILKKFLYKPIIKTLDDRKTSIKEALDAADAARREVAATEQNLRAEIAHTRAEADAIVANAKMRAEAIHDEIVASAESAAKNIAEATAAQIELEKSQAIRDLKDEIADLVVLTTEKLLSEGLSETQEKAIVDKYIKEVGRLQ
jgi:F-type H+-transporting ATPase subunit b